MGYTPVFDHIYQGTLFGRWPAAAVWASLLPLCDKNGVIAYSWTALTGMTGWPIDLLRQGVHDLMQPDPGSNSQVESGKRLVPHEQRDGKDWGWRAVNHGKYRERARKQKWNELATESGADAERKRESRRVQTSPDVSGESTLSDTNTNTNTDKTPLPPEGGFDEFWQAYPKKIHKAAAKRVWSRKGLNVKTGEILAHLEQRVRSDAQWLAERGKYIPHPATWLNGDGWLDEYRPTDDRGFVC